MDWCTRSFENANHPPVAALNHANNIEVKSGQTFVLDASASTDPDKNKLSYEWIYYREAGTFPSQIKIDDKNNSKITFQAPKVTNLEYLHFVVSVTDNGEPALTRYQRVIVKVNP
jgi:hypothetical protein